VNDSIATAPERALAALAAYDQPIVLLAGGRDKDLEWREWARQVAARVKAVVLFGELAPLLEHHLRQAQGQPGARLVRVETLEEAVARAVAIADKGDVVLLSPGGTSFDAFADFAERGDRFRRLVNELQR
jgi:UDP-N-acetylmuramoylalanine--D-glutamate ligase